MLFYWFKSAVDGIEDWILCFSLSALWSHGVSNHYNDYDSGQFMLNWDIFFESANLEDDCIYNILLTNRADVTFCSLFLLVFFFGLWSLL